MIADRFSLHAAVYLILRQGNQVLLLRRYNTGWSDGQYSLIAGHLDGGESARVAMCREAKEEAGIVIHPDDLAFAHVMHRNSDTEYIDFFFVTDTWQGEPRNTEPDKCDEIGWYDSNNLPDNTVPYVKRIIETYVTEPYSETEW